MRGHEGILAMRKRGIRPRIVSIHLGHDPLEAWRDWVDVSPHSADVEILPDESITSLDLRFCHSMLVIVTGFDRARVIATAQACREVAPKRLWGSFLGLSGLGGDAVGQCLEVFGDLEAQK